MTIEQAIKILDPATSIEALAEVEYYAGFHGNFAKIEACNEACDLAVKVMKAVQKGRFVELPCEVGDTLYRICHEYKRGNPFIKTVVFNRNNFWRIVFEGEFGKTVFLTREEAEAALMQHRQPPKEE